MTENVTIALGCLAVLFILIYLGMHVAIALAGTSLIGVWLFPANGSQTALASSVLMMSAIRRIGVAHG